jgi:Mor family transcriptional regulator
MNRSHAESNQANHNASHHSSAPSQWVLDMTDILRDRLAVQDPWATAMAQEIVAGMRDRFGGDDVYVPIPDRNARNERIRAMFNGRNVAEICDRFGLKRAMVYRICGTRDPQRTVARRDRR